MLVCPCRCPNILKHRVPAVQTDGPKSSSQLARLEGLCHALHQQPGLGGGPGALGMMGGASLIGFAGVSHGIFEKQAHDQTSYAWSFSVFR